MTGKRSDWTWGTALVRVFVDHTKAPEPAKSPAWVELFEDQASLARFLAGLQPLGKKARRPR